MTWFLSSLMFNGLLEQGHLLTELMISCCCILSGARNVVMRWRRTKENLAGMHTHVELNTWNTWKPMTRTSLCSGYIAYITIKEGLM